MRSSRQTDPVRLALFCEGSLCAKSVGSAPRAGRRCQDITLVVADVAARPPLMRRKNFFRQCGSDCEFCRFLRCVSLDRCESRLHDRSQYSFGDRTRRVDVIRPLRQPFLSLVVVPAFIARRHFRAPTSSRVSLTKIETGRQASDQIVCYGSSPANRRMVFNIHILGDAGSVVCTLNKRFAISAPSGTRCIAVWLGRQSLDHHSGASAVGFVVLRVQLPIGMLAG